MMVETYPVYPGSHVPPRSSSSEAIQTRSGFWYSNYWQGRNKMVRKIIKLMFFQYLAAALFFIYLWSEEKWWLIQAVCKNEAWEGVPAPLLPSSPLIRLK